MVDLGMNLPVAHELAGLCREAGGLVTLGPRAMVGTTLESNSCVCCHEMFALAAVEEGRPAEGKLLKIEGEGCTASGASQL